MSDFAKEWGDEYNKCSQPLQGKGSLRTVESRTVLESTGPLLKALVALDKTDPGGLPPGKEREKAHAAFTKELKGYKSEAAKYAKTLDVAIKSTSKGEYPEAYRAMKKLRAHLDSISTAIEHRAFMNSKESLKMQNKLDARVNKETEAARKKGMTDNEVKDEVDYAKQLKSLALFSTGAKAATAKAKAAVQAIKSDPTPATYNTHMDRGGRNYTQQVNNLIKLGKDSKCPPKVKALLAGSDKYKGDLDRYGNGDRRTIPLNTSKDDILAYTKTYVQLVKDTYPYVESMLDYLKKHSLK